MLLTTDERIIPPGKFWYKMQVLEFFHRVLVAVAIVLAAGFGFYSSSIVDSDFQPHNFFEQFDVGNQPHRENEQNHEDHSNDCHGRISCETQTIIASTSVAINRNDMTILLVGSLSINRSVYALHPEPPPPEPWV